MNKILLIWLFLHACLLGITQSKTLAIKNVSVINVETGKVSAGKTVIIEGYKIKSASNKLQVPKGATIIDGTGN